MRRGGWLAGGGVWGAWPFCFFATPARAGGGVFFRAAAVCCLPAGGLAGGGVLSAWPFCFFATPALAGNGVLGACPFCFFSACFFSACFFSACFFSAPALAGSTGFFWAVLPRPGVPGREAAGAFCTTRISAPTGAGPTGWATVIPGRARTINDERLTWIMREIFIHWQSIRTARGRKFFQES